MAIYFDSKAGRYRDSKGRFVAFARIIGLVNLEQKLLEAKAERLAEELVAGKITPFQFQWAMQREIKPAIIRMAVLGHNGQPMDEAAWGAVGQFVRQEYSYLRRFTQQIIAGELTQGQIVARAKLYAGSTKRMYERARKRWHYTNGWNEAKRVLDPNAQHCPECPLYATDWTDIENIVPVGSNCSCGGRCRCQIIYRKNPKKAALNPVSELANQILSKQDTKDITLEAVLNLLSGKVKQPRRSKPKGFGV